MNKRFLLLILALACACPSYAMLQSAKITKTKAIPTPTQEQNLTLGVVQKDIKIGTTQDAVAIALGSPNIVTKDADGKDTWIYDKVSSISSYDSKGFGVGLILIGYDKAKGNTQNTQKTLTVVIKFDNNNKVESFNYHMSSF